MRLCLCRAIERCRLTFWNNSFEVFKPKTISHDRQGYYQSRQTERTAKNCKILTHCPQFNQFFWQTHDCNYFFNVTLHYDCIHKIIAGWPLELICATALYPVFLISRNPSKTFLAIGFILCLTEHKLLVFISTCLYTFINKYHTNLLSKKRFKRLFKIVLHILSRIEFCITVKRHKSC